MTSPRNPSRVETSAEQSGAHSEQAALSRELAAFLIEFSIALNKHAMYPSGHPALRPAAESVVGRLATLLEQRDRLAFGVARTQLVIEGIATDPKNPLLSDLAGRLHRHHLGAITFRKGMDANELQNLLTVVAVEAEHSGQPLGLGPSEGLTAWRHARLHALTYERLELVEESAREAAEQGDARSRTRAAQLWMGLTRAALAIEDADEDLPHTDATFVARAINEHAGGTAYDQVIVGYMLQIAEEVGRDVAESRELRDRTSKLVSSLDRGTLQRLLKMGGNRPQRQKFLLNASQGLAVETVVHLVQSASEVEGQTISDSLLRMLQKLARHSEGVSATRRSAADNAVRDQITQLIRGWGLQDPNPTAYREALERMASADRVFAVAPEQRYRPEPRRILEMALEVDVMGDQVLRAVHELTDDKHLERLLHTLNTADAPDVVKAVWAYLETPEVIGNVARREPIDRGILDQLVGRAGTAAAEPLFEALAQSESATGRRVLIDHLVRLGSAVGSVAIGRLDDERWYVQRNILTILAELAEPPPEFDTRKYVQHADRRVRREAIRLLLRDPAQRDRAICVALADGDQRNVLLGLHSAIERCPRTAVTLLVSRATSDKTEEIRTLSIRALGVSGHPAALDALLEFVALRRKFFRWKPPPKSAEYLAALTAVHQFADDERAQRALSVAARSRDPEIASRARHAEGTES